MFTYALHGLRFCSEDADASFADRIGGDKYSDDETFIAVLRALLAPRFGEDTSKSVKVVQDTVVCGSSEDDAAAMSLIERVRMDNSTITIVAMRGLTADARRKMCERIRHLFPGEFPGYQSIETVDQFFAQNKLYISGFINETAQTSVVFVSSMSMTLYHMIAALLPRFIPWHFKESPLTPDEKALLRRLVSDSEPDEFVKEIDRLADGYDFRRARLTQIFARFSDKVLENAIEASDRQLAEYRRQIDQANALYIRHCREYDDELTKKMGLTARLGQGSESDKALVEYLVECQNVQVADVDDTRFTFYVKTYLDNYDPESYQALRNNLRSVLYNPYDNIPASPFMSAEGKLRLADAIFSDDPKLRIKMCAIFQIDIRADVVDTFDSFRFPDAYKDHMPNPHFQYHGCLGDYRQHIRAAIRRGDIAGAVAQCIVSAGSVNLLEDISSNHVFRALYKNGQTMRFIELPDGTSHTPEEAYNWLIENEKESAAE